ncbi:hypothetical protein GIB67_028309, partial [Kingdonia uniflora]
FDRVPGNLSEEIDWLRELNQSEREANRASDFMADYCDVIDGESVLSPSSISASLRVIREVCGMEEPLEIPIISDLTMVLGSISQLKATGIVLDFTKPSTIYDNVKQATAFGMKSVVYVPRINLGTVTALSAFCEKASMGCLVAPTFSIGSILLQQAAITASFHYNNVEIVESRPDASDLPSQDAIQIANNLSGLGQIYNRGSFNKYFESGLRVGEFFIENCVIFNPLRRKKKASRRQES